MCENQNEVKNQGETNGNIYISYEDGEIRMAHTFNPNEQIVYVLGRKGPNRLFEFKKIWLTEQRISPPMAVKHPGRMWLDNHTDCFGPYIVYAENGPLQTAKEKTFTGGNHGYENTGEVGPDTRNTPTGRNISLRIRIDDIEITEGYSGYAAKIEFEWINEIQASNTKKPDGTGRAVLRERYNMSFKAGTFEIRNTIKFLEDCKMECYYGLQLPTDWASDGIQFLEASNTALNSTDTYSDCNDQVCTGFICRRGTDYCRVCIDPNLGIGSKEYLNHGYAAFHMPYKKAYMHLFQDVESTIKAGNSFCFQGRISFFSKETSKT